MPVVVGIDLAAGRGITEVAALVLEDESRIPVFDAASYRKVTSDDEIAAVVATVRPDVVAIDAPLSLPRAVMRGLTPQSHDSVSQSSPAATSPYTRAAERDPIWSTLGIRPFPVSFLGGLTFRAISLLPRLHSVAPQAVIIEVFPSASLRCLDITHPAPARKALKTTEASRTIVQDGLRIHIHGMAPSDEELYGADLLDALAAALTGVAFLRGEYIVAGDVSEGTIVLPGKI